jgi:hypothetical protein
MVPPYWDPKTIAWREFYNKKGVEKEQGNLKDIEFSQFRPEAKVYVDSCRYVRMCLSPAYFECLR